jgi:hypothetical protein
LFWSDFITSIKDSSLTLWPMPKYVVAGSTRSVLCNSDMMVSLVSRHGNTLFANSVESWVHIDQSTMKQTAC